MVFECDGGFGDVREVDGVFAVFAGDGVDEGWVWCDFLEAGEVVETNGVGAEGSGEIRRVVSESDLASHGRTRKLAVFESCAHGLNGG